MSKRKILTGQLLVVLGVFLLTLAACQELEALLPATTRGLVTTLEGHTSTITSLAFSPDGGTLASASADTTVRLWDVATGEELATLNGHPNGVKAVAFSPDGTLLASGSADFFAYKGIRIEENGTPYVLNNGTPIPIPNMVILWDVASGKELRRWGGFTTGFLTLAFSPDGKMLLLVGVHPHNQLMTPHGFGM